PTRSCQEKESFVKWVRREPLLSTESRAFPAGTWSGGVEVVPPSYVTFRVQSSLIREGPLLPPVVRRCLAGNEVIQRQRTGRVVQVGAAGLCKEIRGRTC